MIDVAGLMMGSAWMRLIIIIIKYTMNNLSIILKTYIFENGQNNETTFHA